MFYLIIVYFILLISCVCFTKYVCDFRFSAVFFGGDGIFDEPHSIVVNNQVFTSQTLFLQYFNNIQIGTHTRT